MSEHLALGSRHKIQHLVPDILKRRIAGEGNRTLVSSLGSWRSTIELHPRWKVEGRGMKDERGKVKRGFSRSCSLAVLLPGDHVVLVYCGIFVRSWARRAFRLSVLSE
jgi:hypothetical protein